MYCPQCGTQVPDSSEKCFSCGEGLKPASQGSTDAPAPSADPRYAPQTSGQGFAREQSFSPDPAAPVQPYPQGQYLQEQYPQTQYPPAQYAPEQYLQPQNPQPQYPEPQYAQKPADGLSGWIPYKNTNALLSYYLGVFALIPCFGFFLGPAAFILGLKGLQYAKLHTDAKGQAHAWVGITLGGLCSLVNLALMLFFLIGISVH